MVGWSRWSERRAPDVPRWARRTPWVRFSQMYKEQGRPGEEDLPPRHAPGRTGLRRMVGGYRLRHGRFASRDVGGDVGKSAKIIVSA
jgi:hypothetical protein